MFASMFDVCTMRIVRRTAHIGHLRRYIESVTTLRRGTGLDLTRSTHRDGCFELQFDRLVSLIAQRRPTLFVDLAFLASFSTGYSRSIVDTPKDRIRLFLGANITPVLPPPRSSHDLT